MIRVGFLLFDGFSNMVLSCLLEPLRAVRDQSGIDIRWQVLTVDDQPVRSSSGLSISPDPAAAAAFDMLVVVAGYGFRDHAAGQAPRRIAALARNSQLVLGADSGAWLIAAAGLLRDLPATLHWSLLADFAEAFPDVQVKRARHVMQGRVWSCGGAGSALELMLAFLTERFGPAQAFAASSMFLHDADSQQSPPQGWVGKGSARLKQVVNLMADHIETPLPLPELASRLGLSPSKLDRMFKAELSMAPGRYYQLLRLSQARNLAASSDFDLREIALRCGYGSAAALCKAFRRAYGHPIRQPSGSLANG